MSITGRDTETSLVTTIHICRPCAWVSISSSPETRAEYGRLLKEYLGYNPLDAAHQPHPTPHGSRPMRPVQAPIKQDKEAPGHTAPPNAAPKAPPTRY
jgi:hypothetical protein